MCSSAFLDFCVIVPLSVQFSRSAVSTSLRTHGLQHARPPCPSPTPGAHSLKLMSIESVLPSNHLILCHPFPLPPSICPSIRVFSSESVFRIWWPKYWTCIGQILDKQVLDKVLRGTLLKRQDSQQPKGGNHPDVHRSPVVRGEWWGSSDLLRVASPS